jgi:hypothetical protein
MSRVVNLLLWHETTRNRSIDGSVACQRLTNFRAIFPLMLNNHSANIVNNIIPDLWLCNKIHQESPG